MSIGLRKHVKALFYLAAYRLNRIDMVSVMREALGTYRGLSEAGVREKTRRWYLDEVAPKVAPGAYDALAMHRAQGHRLVLLTSSSTYESEVAVEHLGLDDFLCAPYEVRDGLFTGEPILPLSYGAGKVHYAESYARRHGIDLDASYFYTDSGSDLPMLLRVGHPRIVNPDLSLRREARRRRWPVLVWGRPA